MRGLYLITNDDPFNVLIKKLEVALATNQIKILQYRRKKILPSAQVDEIQHIKLLCEKYHTPFIINDDLSLAQSFGLGVHLGQSDGEVTDAKTHLLDHAIIGRTCANSIELAADAIQQGATYVAFGAIFATATKPEAGDVGLDILRKAKQTFDVPICAIGGLTVENAASVIDAGADLCAVISDVLALDTDAIPDRVHAWANKF
ncbi:thiamine phosphate synthase [Acinetobacter apis]|uniref:Thiamine-phosphate synthase n=1 Tax=Acinetobacter apis TaxID=1229165 RepID=A0A217EFY7_9GAMM|nr:thiamine phosphate synthase [Acinetobacter apis]SNQ29120.1 thiamine-phosphate diphosphorylase [Acinetobacter apis]